jgi:hypothetical protein
MAGRVIVVRTLVYKDQRRARLGLAWSAGALRLQLRGEPDLELLARGLRQIVHLFSPLLLIGN